MSKPGLSVRSGRVMPSRVTSPYTGPYVTALQCRQSAGEPGDVMCLIAYDPDNGPLRKYQEVELLEPGLYTRCGD